MAKKPITAAVPIIEAAPQEMIDVVTLVRESNSFGIKVYSISKDILEKHATETDRTEPDVFNIFEGQLIRKFRELFGLYK